MTKQYTIEQQDKEIAALKRYVYDLKRRHDYAIAELSEITQGVGVKPSWFTVEHAWLDAVKHKAGLAVAKLAQMPLREYP